MTHGVPALRVLVEQAFREGLASVGVEERVRAAAQRLVPFQGTVRIVAAGKAAPAMARGALAALGKRVVEVLVVAPDGTPLGDLDPSAIVLRAAHPYPDARSALAAARAFAVARSAGRTRGCMLLVLLSGGASSLLCAPHRTTLERKVAVVRALIHARASIRDINLVRRHASHIKGGGLLRAARPADVITLLISDVIDGAFFDIGSGPSLPDPTTVAQARAVLARHRAGVLPLRESVRPSSADARRANATLVASPRDLAAATRVVLARAGLRARALPMRADGIEWFVHHYAALARRLERGEAMVRAAEPMIHVDATRPGRGGRSSHLAALVAASLPPGVVFLAAASDGVDGTSGTAGALVDRERWSSLPARDVAAALSRFDSGALHARAGTALAGGPTGHNLADLHVLARAR